MPRSCSSLLLSLLIAWSASAVTMEWTPIGNPGNACDPVAPQGCFGSVGYTYNIGTYEVTNAQYIEFLNAVAATDPNGLYNPNMGAAVGGSGITQTGSSGNYSYAARPGEENLPVAYVNFYDAIRFANWLHNGQPSGAQDGTTTEDGAYTITAQGISNNSITRNPSATIFIPNENEWYKAAYHNASAGVFHEYPFADGFAGVECEEPPGTTSHSANCAGAYGGTFDVGGYPTSPSAHGTFDQGGNVWEWNETVMSGFASRGLRGGSSNEAPDQLGKRNRPQSVGALLQTQIVGFRVAPEPDRTLLLMAGMASLLGLAGWRRARA